MKKIPEKSILIIDDDTGMLRALDKVLTGAGAVVTRAQCAGDAVEILTVQKEKFDLVITDLRMPFVTGLTVVYAIRQIFPALPVIVLTAFGGTDVKAECFRQGAAAFLEKPLDTSELLAAVEKVFALHTNGSGTGGPGQDETTDCLEGNIEMEKNQMNIRPPMTGAQPPAEPTRERNKCMDTGHNTAKARTSKTTPTVIIGAITLARAVRADQMKITSSGHDLAITIPKAA